MINWKEYYDSHLMTAEEAIKMVQSGDRVTFGHACSGFCPSFSIA